MRNPERIEKFLNEIGMEWKYYAPDWRFGQLMSNFYYWLYDSKKRDMFFLEEEEFIKMLKEYLNRVHEYE